MRAARRVRRSPGLVGAPVRRALTGVRKWGLWGLSEPLRSYVVAVPVVAAVLIALAAATTHWRIKDLLIFAAMMAAGVVVIEATRDIQVPHGTLVRDMRAVWYLAIAVLLPPIYVLLAPIPLTVYREWRTRDGVMYRRVFSAAACSLAYACTCVGFHSLPATALRLGSGVHALEWTAALGVFGTLGMAINNGLILGALKLSQPQARLRALMFSGDALFTDLVQLSYAFAITLPVAINPFLLPATVPIVLAQRRFMMHAQLVSQTRIDAKTGLLNAATWQREADVELARAVRTHTPLAVAVADIDHFKSVNDTFGHLAGDQVLRELARSLEGSLRDYDIVGRFGGEEFTLLLPQTNPFEAARIAERIRDQIDQQTITIDDGSREGLRLRVTISIGVATLNGSHRDLNDLIAAADSALYQAKSAGRNTVRVVTDGVDTPLIARGDAGTPG
jgi:diguanylate cyclase (GGDEF)-like protein